MLQNTILPVSNCLNPCSTGITFLTPIENTKRGISFGSLNPCSTGITFLTVIMKIMFTFPFINVLILVLLE